MNPNVPIHHVSFAAIDQKNTRQIANDAKKTMKIEEFIPIEIVSEANIREHWAKKYRRAKNQQGVVRLFLNSKVKTIKLPVIVTLTKVGGKRLDEHDNLPSAFKAIVDEIAVLLTQDEVKGRADSNPGITWKYAYERKELRSKGIKITIEEVNERKP